MNNQGIECMYPTRTEAEAVANELNAMNNRGHQFHAYTQAA